MKIYRIEDETGYGIYQSKNSRDIFPLLKTMTRRHGLKMKSIGEDHYNPSNDKMKFCPIIDECFCAFKKIEDIRKLITKREQKILEENGFFLYEIDIENFYIGQDQIIFKKEDVIEQNLIEYDYI